ncbi:unnamed protein product [Cuscuta campestris]|uniref:Uncharacterized protein n=1 Tax=Cuscuta campestris TaxID=132261 RepID=A0A484NFR8_9ASTE|nr:unnamed protein product [Cuscuta campestris]
MWWYIRPRHMLEEVKHVGRQLRLEDKDRLSCSYRLRSLWLQDLLLSFQNSKADLSLHFLLLSSHTYLFTFFFSASANFVALSISSSLFLFCIGVNRRAKLRAYFSLRIQVYGGRFAHCSFGGSQAYSRHSNCKK